MVQYHAAVHSIFLLLFFSQAEHVHRHICKEISFLICHLTPHDRDRTATADQDPLRMDSPLRYVPDKIHMCALSHILLSICSRRQSRDHICECIEHSATFAYMNLIEHWGSGIPRIIDKVKAAGLQEPEFIGGEVDLRINIYRGQVDGTVDLNNAIKVPDTIDKMPDNDNKVPDKTEIVPDNMKKMPDSDNEVPDTTEKMPDSEQEQQIYKYVLENGSITTAETVEILDVKHRRARAVLLNMVKDGYLRKEGAARSTIYVKNMEGR